MVSVGVHSCILLVLCLLTASDDPVLALSGAAASRVLQLGF